MKLKLNIPETLEEITLEKYQEYATLIKDNPDSEFTRQKTIEIFCGVDLKSLLQISISDVNSISEHLNNLFTTKPDLSIEIDINGTRFGFIPNLEQISYGEFIDLDEYLKDVSTWHNAMAVLYRPITNRIKQLYSIEQYETSEKYAEQMKRLPFSIAYGAVLFFYDLKNELLNASMDYLEKLQPQQEEDLVKRLNLPNGGAGLVQYMRSQMEILQN